MERLLAGTGLYMSSRNLRLMREKMELNLTNRIKTLFKNTGLVLGYNAAGALDTDWLIVDNGSGTIKVNPGIAIFEDYEFVELESQTDAITVTDDSTAYYVLLLRQYDALSETWALRDDTDKEAGTVAVSTGSLVLTGTNTAFDEIFEVGDRIMLDASNAANQKEMTITVVTDATHITVSSTAGDGSTVTLTTESPIDFWHIGKYTAGYPTSGDKNLLEHDIPALKLVTSKSGYSNYIELGTVTRSGSTLVITDSRESNLTAINENNQYVSFKENETVKYLEVTPQSYGAGTRWISDAIEDLTETVIDSEIDYRDRCIVMTGFISSEDTNIQTMPGGESGTKTFDFGSVCIDSAGAIVTTRSKNYFSLSIFFDTGGTSKNATIKNDGDLVSIYARAADGALCWKKTSASYGHYTVTAKIDYSPKFNA